MNMIPTDLMLQHAVSILALGQVWAVMCRAVKMNEHTRPAIRHSMAAQGIAGAMLVLLPWSNPGSFELCVLAFVGASLWVQLATARLWHFGVPRQFQEADHNARSSDATPPR